jgi:hypothetical protein
MYLVGALFNGQLLLAIIAWYAHYVASLVAVPRRRALRTLGDAVECSAVPSARAADRKG